MTVSELPDKPSINFVEGEFYKRGQCPVCLKTAERSKTFRKATYEAMMAAGDAWGRGVVLHKKCEVYWDEEQGKVIGS